jgi:hypothetical protein
MEIAHEIMNSERLITLLLFADVVLLINSLGNDLHFLKKSLLTLSIVCTFIMMGQLLHIVVAFLCLLTLNLILLHKTTLSVRHIVSTIGIPTTVLAVGFWTFAPERSILSHKTSQLEIKVSLAYDATREVLYQAYSEHGRPMYAQIKLSEPAVDDSEFLSWGLDSKTPQTSTLHNVQVEHPRLFAISNRWTRLLVLIERDPYLRMWNSSIFMKAEALYVEPSLEYSINGGLTGNGVLDVARQLQHRVKNWAYAYRMSNDTKWVDRTWQELLVASGNSTQYFGTTGDNWNSQ